MHLIRNEYLGFENSENLLRLIFFFLLPLALSQVPPGWQPTVSEAASRQALMFLLTWYGSSKPLSIFRHPKGSTVLQNFLPTVGKLRLSLNSQTH